MAFYLSLNVLVNTIVIESSCELNKLNIICPSPVLNIAGFLDLTTTVIQHSCP